VAETCTAISQHLELSVSDILTIEIIRYRGNILSNEIQHPAKSQMILEGKHLTLVTKDFPFFCSLI
jgi:hypothetical protein